MSTPGIVVLVDAGNSRVKFGWLQPESGQREPEALALPHARLETLSGWLAALPARPVSAVGVNVAGRRIADTIAAVCTQAGFPITWLSSVAEAAGISNLYDVPTQLGSDRWISLIGLSSHATGAAILATFGTATTIDTLSAKGPTAGGGRRFEGGIILPGPELMRSALANGTAGLPYADGPATPFPRNTHAAISSGIAAAQAGALVHQWRNAIEGLGVAPEIYCTGGGWPLVADAVGVALHRAQADLSLPQQAPKWLSKPVLDGLAAMTRL